MSTPAISRRTFVAALGGGLAAWRLSAAAAGSSGREMGAAKSAGRVALYASIGPEMVNFAADVNAAMLERRDSVTLPANIQYAWPHPHGHFLYIASSNQSGTSPGDQHHVTAWAIDPATGTLRPHGASARLRVRPVNITTDGAGKYLLVASPNPSGLTVHHLESDGTIGREVTEPATLDFGIYAHQVRVAPGDERVVLVTRGNDATPAKKEDPGALKVFGFRDGVLGSEVSVAPNGGVDFGPRHLDFHPTKPWTYVSQERENILSVYDLQGATPALEPRFVTTTLAEPGQVRPMQAASAVHVHPNGKFVYVMNRATGTVDVGAQLVFAGGENSVAVFALDPATGEPRLIQSVDTHGWSARTFSIDPSGRMLVAANQSRFWKQENGETKMVPASLAVFRVGDDGRLADAIRYPIDVGSGTIFWNGFARLT